MHTPNSRRGQRTPRQSSMVMQTPDEPASTDLDLNENARGGWLAGASVVSCAPHGRPAHHHFLGLPHLNLPRRSAMFQMVDTGSTKPAQGRAVGQRGIKSFEHAALMLRKMEVWECTLHATTPNAGELFWFKGTLVNVRVSWNAGEDRASASSSTTCPTARSPPLHIHRNEDEVFHILEGSMRIQIDGTERIAHAGETVLAPKGKPHSFRVESRDGARC